MSNENNNQNRNSKNGLVWILAGFVGFCVVSLLSLRAIEEINYSLGLSRENPRIIYNVKGKPILTRAFQTNEELEAYMQSEEHRRNLRLYSSYNISEK